ncbi:conserved protein of unknown function [Burkholderia multivorans]
MEVKIVYQTDVATGAFMYAATAHETLQPSHFNIPFGCVETPPPDAPAGQVAQWVDGAWQLVADNRGGPLYVVASGAQYEIGRTVEVNNASVSYNGLGAVPGWLTATEPEQAAQEPQQ